MFAFAIHIDFMAVASKEGGTPSFLQSIASAARPNISAQADTPGEFMAFRVDGTGGAEGAQAPPSFLDLCSKNYKISQIREENSFFYLVVPPHKKFASVHPDTYCID